MSLYFIKVVFIILACTLYFNNVTGQNAPAKVVAGIPVNYNEDLAGTFILPDPLVLLNGIPVKDAKTWYNKRRPEIV